MGATRAATYFGMVFHQKLPHNLEDLRQYVESPFVIVHVCRLSGAKLGEYKDSFKLELPY